MGFYRHTSYTVLLGHQRRVQVEFTLFINWEKEFIKLVLSKLETMHYWWIIDSDIENSSFRVEKWSNVLHYYWCNGVIDDVPKIFKLVMPIFDYGQFLSMMEIFIASVPIFLFLLLTLFPFWLILLDCKHSISILHDHSKRFTFLYVF
jgi:hypothetical protein